MASHFGLADLQLDSNDEVSRYFPTPSPRKPMEQQQQHVATQYQNLPENAAAAKQHWQQQQQQRRLETVTPNRLSETNNGLNHSDTGSMGEFRRTASARLHRNKKNYPADIFNSSGDNSAEDSKKKEQVRKRLIKKMCLILIYIFN